MTSVLYLNLSLSAHSENCTEDFVEVYDGMSTINPLIGRYCGHDGQHIISTGSSVLLLFQSGPGGPPWDYSGFDVQVTDRWKSEYEPLLPSGSEERGILGVGSIPVAILPPCQGALSRVN